MDLDKLWNWESRKLACRIREESGNPAEDELRTRFAELAGLDYKELLQEMKNSKRKKEQVNKLAAELDVDKTYKDLLNRSHIVGAAQQSLQKLREFHESHATTIAKKNIKKQYALLPKSPPRRVLLEIQRERAKPLQLPEPDEDLDATTGAKTEINNKVIKSKPSTISTIYRNVLEEEALKKSYEKPDETTARAVTPYRQPYHGDMFGSGGPYFESIIYLSRMIDAENKSQHRRHSDAGHENNELDFKPQPSLHSDASRKEDELHRLDDESFDDMDNEISGSDIGSKLYCAACLSNWSRDPANATRLASEGAVRAIMQLLMEPNIKILRFCASAYRFMSEFLPLANIMIDDGVTNTIADTIMSANEDFIVYNLAIALVNLTRVSGKEMQLVDAAIVLAFQNVIVVEPDLSSVCARGLYNLTCVDSQYNYIERVIRALIALSPSSVSNVKHIVAAALCNLSDLRSVRPRLVEEGTVGIVGQLARGAETRTRRICAVILQNLSASKVCRVEMASKNSVSVAYSLSTDQDPIILRAIGLTLSRLASEPSNSTRIINESGITALCNIGVKYPTIPGISQPIAVAFQLLASRPNAKVSIVQEGSVTAIASLLRLSGDLLTIQHSLLALCHLLTESESHLPIVQQGLVITLMNLVSNENDMIKDFCSLAFFNLSCSVESRKHIVNAGAVIAITSLARHNSDIAKRRCAATLCNVSYFDEGMNRMVSDGIIQCLVKLVLSSDIETVHYSCAALCRLCSTEENGRLILESGAIPNLVKGACDGDTATKQFCGAVLSALSFYEICRIPLCENGILSVLSMLSSLKDDISRQRCLIAYANLSCEKSAQNQMVDEGVVKIIADLAESYQETNYLCCAKAMCNLACNPELSVRLVNDGGIYALLMISMVHSVDKNTKKLCVQAFLNLLNESTVENMLHDGIIGSMANLSKLGDDSIVSLVATLFNQLSKYHSARIRMIEKANYLYSLFHIFNSYHKREDMETSKVDLEIQILIARTCCNLVFCKEDNVCEKTMEYGVLNILEKSIVLHDSETSYQSLQALFSACQDLKYAKKFSQSKGLLPKLLEVVQTSSGQKTILVFKILSLLGWHPSSRPLLQNIEFTKDFMRLVSENYYSDSALWIATILRFIALDHRNPEHLIQVGIVDGILTLNQYDHTDEMYEQYLPSVVEIIRILCEKGGYSSIQALASPSVVALLRKLTTILPNSQHVQYNIAVIIYFYSTLQSESRQYVAIPDIIEVIDVVGSNSKTGDLLAASLCAFLFDLKCRYTFATITIGSLLAKIIKSKPGDLTLNNAISAVFAMSKIPKCRDVLVSPEIAIDSYLSSLTHTETSKVKHNCTRVLKNLSADSSEAIEEGAVAALISLSLDGRPKSRVGNEVAPPEITPLRNNKNPPPSCIEDNLDDTYWFEYYQPKEADAAGKGPEPPSPPAMSLDGSTQYPLLTDDIDGAEVENKTKMAFAKMQVPIELKGSYLLAEEEYQVKLIDSDNVNDDENEGVAAVQALQCGGDFDEDKVIEDSKDISLPELKNLKQKQISKKKPKRQGSFRHRNSKDNLNDDASAKSIDSLPSNASSSTLKKNLTLTAADKGKGYRMNTDYNDKAHDRNSSDEEKVGPAKSKSKLKAGHTTVGEKAAQLGLYA